MTLYFLNLCDNKITNKAGAATFIRFVSLEDMADFV
jgi:hypothetical protein